MHVAEQYELGLDKAPDVNESRWDENRPRDSHNWSEEAFAMRWVLGYDGWEEWNKMPSYERARFITLYRLERVLAGIDDPDCTPPGRLRPFKDAYRPICDEAMSQVNEIALDMAAKLTADWASNRAPSVFTYSPIVASIVSNLIGKHIEAIPKPLT